MHFFEAVWVSFPGLCIACIHLWKSMGVGGEPPRRVRLCPAWLAQVRWTKTAGSASDKFQETSVFNETLRIERIARTQGGRYYCKAENGVGVPAIKSIRVDVQCESGPLSARGLLLGAQAGKKEWGGGWRRGTSMENNGRDSAGLQKGIFDVLSICTTLTHSQRR